MRLARGITRAIAAAGKYSACVYLIVTAVIIYDVTARYLFNAPTYWALELSILLAASQFIIGGLLPTAQHSHVRIDGIYHLAPPAVRRWMDVFASIVAVFYMGFAAFYCWKSAIRAISVWETTASVWNTPSPTIVKTVIALCFTLIALQTAINAVYFLRREPLPAGEADGIR